VFLAPEQLEKLRILAVKDVNFDYFKVDTFSLGITMLELATLEDGIKCYDMKQNFLLMNEIRRLL